MKKERKKRKRDDINGSSILLIYPNTGRQGVVKPACPQMTLKAIVSARLSRPILGVGTTMVHWKMEHGSRVSEGEDRYGRGSSGPWAAARPPNGMELPL